MPTMNVSTSVSVQINFEVYCDICGNGICSSTKVNGRTIRVKCPNCEKKIKEFNKDTETNKDQIKELQDYILDLLKETGRYPTIPEFHRLQKMGVIYHG